MKSDEVEIALLVNDAHEAMARVRNVAIATAERLQLALDAERKLTRATLKEIESLALNATRDDIYLLVTRLLKDTTGAT